MEPEEKILSRKKELAERLIKITTDELKDAPAQTWYEEYIALLMIRPEPAAGRACVEKLMRFYNKNIKKSERELSILGLLQFMEPSELGVPFNQHLWHETFINDVRAIFSNQFPSVSYYDDDITAYWLKQQSARRSEERKIRVVFVVRSAVTCDKVLPVYEEMKRRENFEPYIVIHPEFDYRHSDGAWKYFFQRYPDDKIYDYSCLMDIRKLKPDYVFFNHPYVRHRPFPSLRVGDLLTFTKICMISYGASLAYVFPERLFRDYGHVYKNLYALFASCESVKTMAQKQFAQDETFKYRHVEFLGYPALKTYYRMEKEPSKATRILWTPRWLVDDKWGGSHFLEYKDKFNALREKYGERVELSIRPHMYLFNELLAKNFMTEEEITAYKKDLKTKGIVRQKRLADMDKSIRNIDIFLADYSSILICLFLTGRPIIYCELPNAVPFPEYKEMFAAMYTARSWEDVEFYLAELMAGNDPLFERRQAIAQKIFETHKDAAKRIADWLTQDFKGVGNYE